MGVALLSAVKSLLLRALRRHTMAQPHTLKSLLDLYGSEPGHFSVSDFESSFMSHCKLLALSIDNLEGELLSTAYIKELWLVKEIARPEHEYIVALVSVLRSGDSISLGVIKCERTVHDDVTPARHVALVVNDVVRGSASPPSFTSSSSDLTTDANDRVLIFDPDHEREAMKHGHSVLYRWTYTDGAAPSLVRFVVSAAVLHLKAPYYSLLHHQCFWYAAMLFRMVAGPQAGYERPQDNTMYQYYAAANKIVSHKPGRFMDLFRVVTTKDIEAQAGELEPVVHERFLFQDRQLGSFRDSRQQAIEARTAAQEAEARNAALQEELAAKDRESAAALAAKDQESAAALSAKDAALAAKDQENAALREELARIKAQSGSLAPQT